MRPQPNPPEIAQLLRILSDAEVAFVVVGSVAAHLYGAPVAPGDLDVVPDLTFGNLQRLAGVLKDLDARPSSIDQVSTWERAPDGEWKWHQRAATSAEREALLSWSPSPHVPTSFDHLLYTRLGNLDIVPVIAGEFSALAKRAAAITHDGAAVLVAHVDDLLATLTVPRRAKDVERVLFLRALQRARPAH